MANGTSDTQAIFSISQLGQSLYANYLARSMESDRVRAGQASDARETALRAERNATTAALSTTQRWLQSQRTQRAVKNAEVLFAQGQEAIAGLSRQTTERSFGQQIQTAQAAGAASARSAANGVSGDALPAEMAISLAGARQEQALRDEQAVQLDDLTIRSSRAAAAAPVAGDFSAIMPGLDRRFTQPTFRRWMPNAWQTLLGGVNAMKPDERANLLNTVAPTIQRGVDWLRYGSGNLGPEVYGEGDR